MKLKLANLAPLKEGSMQARDLADRNSLQQLKAMYDELLRDMEQEAEPEGGPIADQYADQMQDIEDAMQIKSPFEKDSVGGMTYDQAIGRDKVTADRDAFERSSKFKKAGERSGFDMRGLNEATEKSWNAIDVSRKAEKEIDNKEWNSRTTKKLDMLKALNKSGKFKKDWGEDKLQGWVDQNYSWEKLARQFKNVNEMKATKNKNLLTERFQELAGIKPLYQEDKGDSPMPFRANPDANDEWSKNKIAQDSASQTKTVQTYVNKIPTEVTINYRPGSDLKDVTISFEYAEEEFASKIPQSFNVDFEYEDTGDDHGNEGMDTWFTALSEDGKWEFGLEVYVEASFHQSGNIGDWDWDTLEITQLKNIDKTPMGENDRFPGEDEAGMAPRVDDYRLEPEDMDDPDEDLVIIGSGYLDIKSNFGERPSQTNGEYAALGQKVVDQLHNGDKDAALDYIYSQINEVDEGSCGYSQEAPGGEELDTPGGTKGMDADTRTTSMMREVIRKEIKKLSEGGSLDDKLKGAFSPEEWDKITNKPVPSFADIKSKEKSSKAKKEMDKFLNKLITKHGTTDY